MVASRTMNESASGPVGSSPVTPRALALLMVGAWARRVGSDGSLAKEIVKWASSMPRLIEADFATAREELMRLSVESITRLLKEWQPERRAITDVLGELLLREEDAGTTKSRGAVFTPYWLARRVTLNCQGHWRRLHRTGRPPSVIGDVSCGVGVFLYSVSEVLGGENRIIGIDSHPGSIAYTRLLKWALGAKWDLVCEDTLMNAPHTKGLFVDTSADIIRDGFDILIGNPPYVRSALLPRQYAKSLRSRYTSVTTGNYDLSVAFIEHALETLNPDGIASYILTNKFMTSAYGRLICRRLAQKARLLNIEDFQDYQVFRGYTTYTCVLTFARKPPAKRFTVTRFSQGVAPERDPGPGENESFPNERLNVHPWEFAAHSTQRLLRLLRDPRHPLLSVIFTQILQGMRTGANHVFVISSDNEHKIEPELLRPYVDGEHIRRGRIEDAKLRLIFPYQESHWGELVPIDEEQMQDRYPRCWSYLFTRRSVLSERSGDIKNPWYAYSRSQNLDLAFQRKLLVREMMPRAEFAADNDGAVAFCSGYGLVAHHMDARTLTLWTSVLCTPTMEFSLRHSGTQLQSGWFRLLKHHLSRVRLPHLSGRDLELAIDCAKAFHRDPDDPNRLEALDDVVSKSFGLKTEHREEIAGYLEDCHRRSLGIQERDECDIRPSRSIDRYQPVQLPEYNPLHRERGDLRHLVTFAPNKEAPIHRWYRYTQGFSGELVNRLIEELRLGSDDVVLDPFMGCGTTLLACRQTGIPSIGIEISPLIAWVARGKVYPWQASELELLISKLKLPTARTGGGKLKDYGIFANYLAKAFAPRVLDQIWAYAQEIDNAGYSQRHRMFFRLGIISIMEEVSQIRKHGSHYRYMLKSESAGLQKLNIQILDPSTDIKDIFLGRLRDMVADIRKVRFPRPLPRCNVILGDARRTGLPRESISAVITSPPYLNRNNYIAQQKAELALLGMVKSQQDYRALVRATLRSHIEGEFVKEPRTRFPEIRRILDTIRLTKNNNPKIPHMIAGYFEDIADVLGELYRIMRPGAVAAFVLGNTRWGGVVVPVDHLILRIAEQQGFRAEKVLVTRVKGNSPQQMRQFGRIAVRESIVVFRK